jgi:hypothetical protein
VPDPRLHVLALFAQPLNAFRATRGAKPERFGRRLSTGEFEFNAAQKVDSGPLFWLCLAFLALKNQFVFGLLKI